MNKLVNETGKSEVQSAGSSRRSFIKTAAAGAALSAVAYAPGLAKPAWAQRGVVKFGCSLPLSGNFEQVSKLYRAGYEFWSESVKNKIRVGDRELPIEWVFYDDEFNPARTAQLTERMITTDKVDCIVGTYGTDTVLAQGAVARRYKKITIQGGAAAKRVDDEIGGEVTFTMVGSASVYPKLAIEFLAAQNPKPRRIATITYDDAAYKEMTAAIKAMAPALGMEVVIDIELPVAVQDLRPTVLKLKRERDIDLVYCTGHDVPLIKFIQECAALDFNPKAIVGGHLTTNPTVKNTLQDKLQDVYGVTLWLPQFTYKDPHFASCQEFFEKFKASKGFAPTYHCALAYTIPLLYELALRDSRGADPTDNQVIRQKLIAMNNVETIWGPIKFSPKGRIESEGLPVIQWQGKDPVLKVLHPSKLSDGKIVYPTQPWAKRS
jgi:branched-chain amino acid transport system substrate-binding protein